MKNKKILIIIAVLFATLLIILAGTLFVFFKTDLFKSNKQLFFENTINTFQFTKDFNFDNLIDTEKDLQGKPQTKKGIITVEPNFTEYIIPDEIKNVIDNSYIGYVFNSNPEDNKSELMIGAYHEKKKIESITLLNDNDKIGLYCYDLYPKCIYFENNNLKEYFKKFNINTDFLPDKITNYSLTDRYNDSKKISENIMKKYSEIITTKLDEKNFKNTKNVETTINGEKTIASQYSLTLSEVELLDLQIEFMEAVKNDENLINQYIEQSKKNNSTLSNFLLSINFSKYLSYISNSNLDYYSQIEDLYNYESIKKYIDEVIIKDLTSQKEKSNNDKKYVFNVYSSNKNNSSKFEIIFPKDDNSSEEQTIYLDYTKNSDGNNIINLNMLNYLEINLTYNKISQNNSLKTDGLITISLKNNSHYYSSSSLTNETSFTKIFKMDFNLENSNDFHKFYAKLHLISPDTDDLKESDQSDTSNILENNELPSTSTITISTGLLNPISTNSKNFTLEINSETTGILGQDKNTTKAYINLISNGNSVKINLNEYTEYSENLQIDTSKFENGLCINKYPPTIFEKLFEVIKSNYEKCFEPKMKVFYDFSEN